MQWGSSIPSFFLAQVEEANIDTVEDAALMFSGPQFFTALIAGLVLAFAFQLLFTNLGIATGISLAGGSSSDSSSDSDGIGGTLQKIGLAVGIGTLISVAISLFVACLFAVKLSLFASPFSGAIVGLVIWGTYFSLMVWFSSTTVGSLVGSVVNTATSGFQALVGTAAAAIGGKAASQQVVATAEAAAAAVRREITSGIDPVSFRENVEDYLTALKPSELDLRSIRDEFEGLLNDPNLQEIADSDRVQDIDRGTFVSLISNQSNLSKREVNRIAEQLEGIWKDKVQKLRKQDPLAELGNYLRSATSEQLLGVELSDKVDTLIQEMRERRKSQNQGQGPIKQAIASSFNSLTGLVMGRTDLSDLDVEKVGNQLQKLKEHLGEQSQKVASQLTPDTPYSTVRADIENHLSSAYPWQLEPEVLDREFREMLYDPDADPGAVARELKQISRSNFIDWLQERETSAIFTQAKIRSLANRLDTIRLEVLAAAEAAYEREQSIALFADVETCLLNQSKAALTPENIQLRFKPILEDSDADDEQLRNRLSQFDRATFDRLLEQRGDLNEVERSAIANELEIARDRALQESQELADAAKVKVESQWLKVQSYLRDTNKAELNPNSIQRELKLMLDDPQAGASALKARMSRFDRDTLVQLFAQRQDMSEEEVNEIIDRVESGWTQVRYAPQKLAEQAQVQYDQATSAIADYLRGTNKAELNPDGIRRDLTRLLDDPKSGFQRIKNRVAAMDRDTLVQLLSQRDDLSEEQVNQTIDEVQSTLYQIAKAPRRLAKRTQKQVGDFKSAVADYLRSTDKEQLNPDAIQRDVQLLLDDPRAGMENLQERLSQMDRDTLVQLLSQRDDIAEEDVEQIIDQILAVRDRAMAQLQLIQRKVESALEQIFAKIRNYLNSLERPELNYDGIQHDLKMLFDDPEVGFDALRDRFSSVDRNTLVAVLSSRDDISSSDAERLVSQVERNRDRVLQRAERLQQRAIHQLEQTKLQAQRQLEETRKTAAAASWWLFLTALISAGTAALGGALGVVD
ncbi:MFS transporter [Lusitaniella coriacea LEGE 07157]|uniref:MFS transporter n=1 Tax=Lusitaniella coriacea LEGE 07157 TaxID=945747 RepID=A0A8J7DZU0_9CYAN|nr:MFS transporter [Lusitaniella coriacea LEGE 07157]